MDGRAKRKWPGLGAGLPLKFPLAENPPAGPGKHYGVTREQ